MRLDEKKKKNPFIYAVAGIVEALKTEPNLRFEFIMAILVVICSFILKISTVEWAIIILLIGLVITAELINTAIETVVDLVTREKNELARKAKDISAGFVLIISITSAIIGCLIFIPKIISFIF